MSDYLGLGLAHKLAAARDELFTQIPEILDDAVVHDGDQIGGMRMRIIFRRTPWVAQRVWPIPIVPPSGSRFNRVSSACNFL